MRILKKGLTGLDVSEWQYFLIGMKCYNGIVDMDFGNLTHVATIKFQTKYKLGSDGVVGRNTYSKAISLGFKSISSDDVNVDKTSENFPVKPTDISPIRGVEKDTLFGKIEYIAAPTPTNKEAITITNGYQKENIIMVDNPYLSKATNGKYTKMKFHKDCAYQLLQMFKEWDEVGILDKIITYGGSYISRFIRGSRKHLSGHSYGTAFDINMAWNGLGRTPALVGQKGCVREMVAIAEKWGFYWGGHFSRKDGMHFEVYKIISKS